jgi:hypothetical protein
MSALLRISPSGTGPQSGVGWWLACMVFSSSTEGPFDALRQAGW